MVDFGKGMWLTESQSATAARRLAELVEMQAFWWTELSHKIELVFGKRNTVN